MMTPCHRRILRQIVALCSGPSISIMLYCAWDRLYSFASYQNLSHVLTSTVDDIVEHVVADFLPSEPAEFFRMFNGCC